MKIDRDTLRQVLNLVAILAAFGINVISNIAPVKGLSIGEISNLILKDVLITPASYAFAIWGLIYLGLISFAIYQAQRAQRDNPHLHSIGYLLVVSSLAQIVWVFLFQYQMFSLSLVAMLGILLPLIGVYLRLKTGQNPISKRERWLIHRPLTIYFAWISVATIVNVAIVLYKWGWNGWGISPQLWTAIVLVLGAAVPATIGIRHADVAYVGVFVWALIAIALRHTNTLLIAGTAAGVALALLILAISILLHKRKLNFKI